MSMYRSLKRLMKGSSALYIWSLAVQVFMVLSTIFSTFLSKVLTDALTSYYSYAAYGYPDALTALNDTIKNSFLEKISIELITLGRGPKFLLDNLWILPVAVGVAGLISALLTCYRFYIRVKASVMINRNMQMLLFSHMVGLPYPYFKKNKSGDILQTSTRDLDVIRRFLMMDMSSLNYTLWMVVICFTILMSISPKFTLISLSPFPVMFIYSFFLIKKVRKLYRATDDSEAIMTDKIAENLNSVRIVKAYNSEVYEINEFEGKLKDYQKKFIKWRTFSSFFFSSTDILVFGSKVLSLILGVAMVFSGEIGYGTLVISFFFVNMMVWPLRDAADILSKLGQTLAALDRINKLLDQEVEDIDSGKEFPIQGNIEFNDVHFSYDDANEETLKGVNFSIKKGETIAIMGKTGSGKSSIIQLLLGLYPYEKGSIKIDGIELKDIQKRHLRQNVVPVLQDPFLFSKTIIENIRMAKPDATKLEIENSTKMAKIHDSIASFPSEYETPVGEKGVTLSGGQKQRLAIARALISNAPIMIFDDSLSAVDMATDFAIRSELAKLKDKATIILITQRVMSAKDADKILIVEDGKISQAGKHEELLKQKGLYRQIYDIQAKMNVGKEGL